MAFPRRNQPFRPAQTARFGQQTPPFPATKPVEGAQKCAANGGRASRERGGRAPEPVFPEFVAAQGPRAGHGSASVHRIARPGRFTIMIVMSSVHVDQAVDRVDYSWIGPRCIALGLDRIPHLGIMPSVLSIAGPSRSSPAMRPAGGSRPTRPGPKQGPLPSYPQV